jgi:hypothetical protein
VTPAKRAEYADSLKIKVKKDTGNLVLREKLAKALDTSQVVTEKEVYDEQDQKFLIQVGGKKYRSKAQYDSAQQVLPKKDRDGWVVRRLINKAIDINDKYSENPQEAWTKLGESVLHRLPYMLFVSLPLFALILQFVYIRRRQFYYADHGVFTIHLYVFTFILLMAVFALGKLDELTGGPVVGLLMGLLIVTLFFYLYKAMRNFYGQRRGKTVLKFLLVTILSLLMIAILFVLFAFFSAFTL